MMRKLTPLVITTTGVDGSATGSGTTDYPVSGYVVGVHLDYSAGQAATADVVVKGLDPDTPILTVGNNATDGWYWPKVQASAVGTGANISAEYHDGVPVDGYINVAVAQGDDDETVTVTLVVAT